MVSVTASKLLTLRNARKHRGLFSAVFLLSLIAGLLSNVAVVMLTQHSTFLTDFAAKLDTAQAVAIVPATPAATQMEERLRADERVEELTVRPGVGIMGQIPFADDTMPANFFFYDVDAAPKMNRWQMSSQSPDQHDSPIWVPATLEAAGRYKLGDELTLTSALGERKFHVQGFLESPYGGMPSMGLLWFGLPHDDFTALQKEADDFVSAAGGIAAVEAAAGASFGWVPSRLLEVRSGNVEDGRAAVQAALEASNLEDESWEMDLNIVVQGNSISVGLVSVTILVFAIMIAAVAVLVLAFMLRAAMRDDLPTVGALRALGFTSAQVMRPLVLPLTVLAALSAALGAGASYAVFPFLGKLLRSQTGLYWQAEFSPTALAAVMAALGVLIWASGALAARRAAKLTAVMALRGGQRDHSTSRNLLPLRRTRGSLPALLGIKELLAAPGHALLILIVSAACSLGSVYALSGTGLLIDKERALPLLTGGIMPQVTVIDSDPRRAEYALETARALEGVQAAFYFNQGRLSTDEIGLFALIADEFDKLPLNPLYEGRYPRHANEIVVGSNIASRFGLEVGSTWELKRKGTTATYLVTGLASSALNAGEFALMTREGYRSMVPDANLFNVGVYARPGVDAAELTTRVNAAFDNEALVVNSQRALQVQVSGFQSMVPLLTYSLMVFAVVVVVLVIGLFTFSLVSRSLPSSGLLKALGFTSRQAARRVRWTVLPPVLLGVIGGGALGAALIGPLLTLTLSGAGIKKVAVSIPVWPSYLVTAFTLATALVVVYAATRPISQVSARTLLVD